MRAMPAGTSQPEDPLENFRRSRYLNLETYRRDGTPVRTPMWFVERNGTLYVRTPTGAGKLKRIAHNPQARIAPCTVRGTPLGDWVSVRARVVSGEEAEQASQLLLRKYGWRRRLIDLFFALRRRGHVVIALERAADPQLR